MKRCKTCHFLPCRCEDLAAAYTLPSCLPSCWPMKSEALAVHPKQIGAAVEDARKKGVSVDFTKDGRVIFRDRNHRAEYLRAYGYFDRDAGYGDPSPGSFRGDRPDERKPDYYDGE
jgi:hypothetical protein